MVLCSALWEHIARATLGQARIRREPFLRAVEAAIEAHPEWTDLDVLALDDPQAVLRSYRP